MVDEKTKEAILSILYSSKSWAEVHSRLDGLGYRYERKGPGAILIDQEGHEMKPSHLDRHASLKNMEKRQRLGPFKEAGCAEANPDEDIYTKFAKLRESLRAGQQAVIDALTRYHDAASGTDADELAALEAYRLAVPKDVEDRNASLIDRAWEKLEKGKKIQPPSPDFEAWAILNPAPAQGRIAVSENAEREHNPSLERKKELFLRYHDAVGADRYRVTARKEGQKSARVLDKDETGLTEGFRPQEVVANIEVMTKAEESGRHVYLTPLSESRHHLFIDDVTEEALLKLKRDGLFPNAVIESSEGNYQAVFTVDKLGTENDLDCGNRMATSLNRLYGDVNFCGAVHPHRAPGFMNVKESHRQADGTFFAAGIIETRRGQCPRLKDFLTFMDGYYEWQRQRTGELNIPRDTREYGSREQAALYMAHHADVMRINEKMMNEGRAGKWDSQYLIDYMVAIRLRATGKGRQTAAILREGNILLGAENSGRLAQYCGMVAKNVFTSPDANEKIKKYKYWIPAWERIEREALAECEKAEAAPKAKVAKAMRM